MEKPTDHPATPDPAQQPQFTLRTLMLVILVFSLGLGWIRGFAKSQEAWRSVREIEQSCNFDYLPFDKSASPWWQRMLSIDLPPDIEELRAAPHGKPLSASQDALLHSLRAFPHLKRLTIYGATPDAEMSLFANLPNLEELELLSNDEYMLVDIPFALPPLPRLKRLSTIYLHGKGDLQYLANMPALEDLTVVVHCNDIEWSRLKPLRRLHIRGAGPWANSKSKRSGGSLVNPQFTTDIVEIASLQNLERLELKMGVCTDQDLSPLVQCKNLQHLTLESELITDACLVTLEELSSLTTLEIKGENLSQAAIDQCKAKRTGLTITKK